MFGEEIRHERWGRVRDVVKPGIYCSSEMKQGVESGIR